MDGYDIIGDVHGCATQLEALLDSSDIALRQANTAIRTAGHLRGRPDLRPRRRAQLRVLEIVESMVEARSAMIVMGVHEFNALAYHTEWPHGSKFLRPHDDPENPSRPRT